MTNTPQIPKPVQAGDYGKIIPKKPVVNEKTENRNTDGRKTLALWSN
ncbi:MAG: hypothetical protein JKY71_10420 [Alphaproteobacteria bacterium]|nr:hypothetical protein [Alphaproteobacteria bacterium]